MCVCVCVCVKEKREGKKKRRKKDLFSSRLRDGKMRASAFDVANEFRDVSNEFRDVDNGFRIGMVVGGGGGGGGGGVAMRTSYIMLKCLDTCW